MGSKELERAVQETVMLIHVWGLTSSACFWWGHRNHALGERLNGIQEVSGSIPLISTKKRQKPIGFCLFFANGVGNLSDMWYTKPKGGAWERHFKRSRVRRGVFCLTVMTAE